MRSAVGLTSGGDAGGEGIFGVDEGVVAKALQVGGDLQGDGTFFADGLFDGGGEAVGLFKEDGIVVKEVDIDVVDAASIAEAEGVEADVAGLGLCLEELVHLGGEAGICGVHEAADALPDEGVAGVDDIGGHEDAADGVPGGPARPVNEGEAEDGAEAGPAIGEDVFTIGDEDECACLAPLGDEVEAEGSIDDDGEEGEDEALIQVAGGGPFDPPGDGLVEDEGGGKDDEETLQSCGEEGDLAVAVRVIVVCGLIRQREAEGGKHDGDHVDDGLCGIPEHPGGSGEDVGGDFDAQHQKSDG